MGVERRDGSRERCRVAEPPAYGNTSILSASRVFVCVICAYVLPVTFYTIEALMSCEGLWRVN